MLLVVMTVKKLLEDFTKTKCEKQIIFKPKSTKSNYMLNGKAIIILLIIGLIKKDSQSEWIFSETETFGEICENWVRFF